MGVNLTDILVSKEISVEDLKGKTIAVDASNWLYQFLSVIRQPDGSLLTDKKGRVTSHLMGLFTRNIKLIQLGINLVYVFDGEPPKLKLMTQQKRQAVKIKAEKEYKKAAAKHDIEEMRKYASMTSRLTQEMVEESKELLHALGIPFVQALSEGEAQAAFLVKNKDAYAVGSQDADSLLFGSPKTIKNIGFSGKRRIGKSKYANVSPELFDLKENLKHLEISHEQLVTLAMLVGTDYNYGGIHGIGPKRALELVKKYGKSFDRIFSEAKWDQYFSYSWEDVFNLFLDMKVTEKYKIKQTDPNKDKIIKILIDEHDFSEERVNSLLETFLEFSKKRQKGLGEFI